MGNHTDQPGDRSRASVRGERGSMLIEVMVSAVLLIVLALAALAIIDRSGEASAMNRARSVATALGQQDQEYVRQMPWSKLETVIPDSTAPGTLLPVIAGDSGSGRTIPIDSIDYNVATTVEIKVDTNSRTACLAGWKNKRVLITTKVTPPSGIKMKPVVMRTERVPLITDKADTGSVIVQLTRADGTPADGVPVSIGGNVLNTDQDGCRVRNNIDPTPSMTVSWGEAGGGWVDPNGAPVVTRVLSIVAGRTAQLTGRFDSARTAVTTFQDEDGNPGAWNSVTFVNGGITTVYNGVRSSPVSASPFTDYSFGGLFPFTSPYGVFAGNCWGNDPTIWGGTPALGNSGQANAFSLAAGSGTLKVLLPRVRITTPAAAGYRVFLRQDFRSDLMGRGRCDKPGAGILPPGADPNYNAAPFKTSTAAAGGNVIDYPLPYGIYSICIDNPPLKPGQRLNLGATRVDNVPPGTPFYTEGRTKNYAGVSSWAGGGECAVDGSNFANKGPWNP